MNLVHLRGIRYDTELRSSLAVAWKFWGDSSNFGNHVDCCMSTFTNEGERSELVLERSHKYPVATIICVLRNHDNHMLLYTLSHCVRAHVLFPYCALSMGGSLD